MAGFNQHLRDREHIQRHLVFGSITLKVARNARANTSPTSKRSANVLSLLKKLSLTPVLPIEPLVLSSALP
jgi:hypothetical protein